MTQPFNFLNLFVELPGNLFYFLVIIAISQAGLFMVLGHRSDARGNRAVQRYTVATFGIVLAWTLLLAGALFSLVTERDAASILPPLERAAEVVSILLLGWAFITADHRRWGRLPDVFIALMILVTIAGYLFTATQWMDIAAQSDFNLSPYGFVWAVASLILVILGFLFTLVFFRFVLDAPLKLVYFTILALGYIVTLYQVVQFTLIGNESGAERLAFIAAMAIMPAVIYRMVTGQLRAAAIQDTQASKPISPLGQLKTSVPEPAHAAPISPIQRHSVQLLKSLGDMLEGAKPESIPTHVIRAALDAFKADVSVVLRLKDANYADVVTGYDRSMDRHISGMAINLDEQPTLVNAIERRTLRPLFPDRNLDELRDLYTRLDIDQIGPCYLQPLVHNNETIGMLIVATPYSRYELLPSEVELLKGIGVIAGSLLAMSYAAHDERVMAEQRAIQAIIEGTSPGDMDPDETLTSRHELESKLEGAREQIAQLSRQVMHLKLQLDDEQSRLSNLLGDSEESMSISQRLMVLNDEQRQLREERDQLMRRLQEMEAAYSGVTATSDEAVVDNMVEALRREQDALKSERDRLQRQLDDLRARDRTVMPNMQTLIESMSEEKVFLESERDQLRDKLKSLETQLDSLGIEGGPSGLAQLITELFKQRADLMETVESLKKERNVLKAGRALLEEKINSEVDRDTHLQSLHKQIERLAADREALLKERNKLRSDREEMRVSLDKIKEHRGRLLENAAKHDETLQSLRDKHQELLDQVRLLTDARSDLIGERDRLIAEKQALEAERDQLLARSEGNRQRLQEVNEEGVGALRKMIDDLTEERNLLEHDLSQAQAELSQTRHDLERMQVATVLNGSDTPSGVTYQPDDPQLVVGLVQELRTPMTSITGYVDLLLGESAGILGEMQRKFLQRVSANVIRLATMIDDLVSVTELDTGQFKLSPEPVDVISLVEDAITNASKQFREKELTVNFELDDDMPPMPADRDALNQIFGQLLTNAYLVSPPNSNITVVAKRQPVVIDTTSNELVDSLYVSVADRGGGIANDDIPRVFARKYKADNPLIEGLGDTGVGLSIANALVRAHGGRLWVETQPGVGSIFNFALPLNTVAEAEEG